jgi:adenine-specific DNA-methyltransferase
MDGKSLNQQGIRLQMLRELYPEVVSEQGIDWERLRLTLGDDIALANERYVLTWAGKSDSFKAIQTPTTATLNPQRSRSVDFDSTQNILIEGENLDVLKVLQKSYYGKVKMIYLDPPYNTGNDSFVYPDRFSESKEDYLRRIGELDESGYLTKEGLFRKNSKENGQFHSNWLSMLYPRLFLARNLLKDDGVIFISIDDNEVHNLRMVMDEIFGEENRIESFVWKKSYGGGAKEKYAVTQHEHVLFYAKHLGAIGDLWLPPDPDAEKLYYKYRDEKFETRGPYRLKPLEATKSMDRRENLIYTIVLPDGRGIRPKRQWWWSRERVENALKAGEIVISGDADNPSVSYKQYLRDEEGNIRGAKPFSIIDGIYTQRGTQDLLSLFPEGSPFQFPKPVDLLKWLISIGTDSQGADIILDFFAGSGTTGHAVMELNRELHGNRRYVLVQMAEGTQEDSNAYKSGYQTITQITEERLRRVSKNIVGEVSTRGDLFRDKPLDFGFRTVKLEHSNFKMWRADFIDTEEELKEQLDAFVDPVRDKAGSENLVWEILLKSGHELSTTIETIDLDGHSVHSIAGGELIVIVEAVNQAIIDAIVAMKPGAVICLDRLFADNDQLKTNSVLQMKDAGVTFRTI